jgi:hypothetical protein
MCRSEKTGQGWMASNETIFAFTALDKIMEVSTLSAKIRELEDILTVAKNDGSLNALVLQQYSIQLEWLKTGSVPHLEFMPFSRGFVKPDPEGNYFILNSGLQVCYFSLAPDEKIVQIMFSIRSVVVLW